MITRDGKLEIFERFEVDPTLPKFRRNAAVVQSSFTVTNTWAMTGLTVTADGGVILAPGVPWYRRLLDAVLSLFRRRVESWTRMPVDDFFQSVKNSAEELKLVETRLAGYKKALADAERNGQVALRERLAADVEGVRAESQLRATDQVRFVTEETLVRFVRASERGLRLDFVKNFMRVIPADAAAKKARCDELGIFDNYAILHHDPDRKSWAETEAEKLRRKGDPILFGLIRGRRRLYFVADWVDETCDLTFDEIADTLGKDAVAEVPAEYHPEDAP